MSKYRFNCLNIPIEHILITPGIISPKSSSSSNLRSSLPPRDMNCMGRQIFWQILVAFWDSLQVFLFCPSWSWSIFWQWDYAVIQDCMGTGRVLKTRCKSNTDYISSVFTGNWKICNWCEVIVIVPKNKTLFQQSLVLVVNVLHASKSFTK